MSKGKIRDTLGFILIIGGFLSVLYLIFRIKGYAAIAGSLPEDKVAGVISSIRYIVVLAGFLIGTLMGAIVQRSTFCIAAACHNIVTTQDLTQTRAYAMALFVAILGVQILYMFGHVDINYSVYLSSPFTWLSYIVGGFIFGVGIVYGGGCASRILVRAGEGNLGGLITVIAFIFSSSATLWGITARLRVDYLNSLTLSLPAQYLPEIIKFVPWWVVLFVIEVALAIFMLISPKGTPWRSWRWPLAGAAIGLTIVLGWWVNGAAHKTVPIIDSFSFSSPSDPSLLQKWRPWSLTFAAADAQAFRYLILWTGETINFAISSVFGVIFGSLIAALYTRTFNWVAPTLQQFKYNLVGGLLMGFGAIVAMGCNIGQGLSGISTLSVGSILTMIFIFIGAISGAKYMNWRIMREL
ncbi:MAG: YeeE/YedE family protein [Nitrospirota bacterium]